MTIVDLEAEREARRPTEREQWFALMDRRLAEIRRVVEQLTPFVQEWIAAEKARPRGQRCEAPKCSNTLTTLHPVRARGAEDPPALVRLCPFHTRAVRSGRLRVSADGPETLLWELYDPPDAPPKLQIRWPRRRRPKTRGCR